MLEVGLPIPRFDARDKVTGQERYAADHYPERLLWAGAKRAGIPHGRIRAIDTAAAVLLPGVHVVLTAKDVPGTNRQGIVHKDQPVLAEDRVRHCGDPVALVLAETPEIVREALDLVRVDLEPLPGVFSPREALAPGAPLLHERGNILMEATIEQGRALKVLADCDVVIEESFAVPFQDHAFLETQNGTAVREANGLISLVVSTQSPFRDRFEIAHALGLQACDIRVQSPYLGGAFGGKDGATVQCLLALAAIHASGRPVRMQWDREECFMAGYKRHAVEMHYRLGAGRDGILKALHARLSYDTGAYAHLGGEVMELGMEHAAGPYRVPNSLVEGLCVYTNNPVAGAMRGFGVCQVSFAFESMMDLLAERLCMDPLDLRLRNALRRGDRNAAGVTLIHSTGMVPCLETLRSREIWAGRDVWKRNAGPFKRRGVGIAAVFNAMGYGRGLPDSAIAKVELTEEGRIRIYSGVSDMGQGNASTFVQMAGEILCQDEDTMEIFQPDTDRSLPSGSSTAGRTTYTYGNALIRACRSLRKKLIHRAALLLMVETTEGMALLPGRVRHLPSGREAPLAVIARMLPEGDRTCTDQFIMDVSKDTTGTGQAFPIGFPHVFFSYGAHAVRVEVDELTGKAEVLDYLAVTDGGRVINPRNFEQQVQGAVAQGLGYALMEELLLQDGWIDNPDFAGYMLPTFLDVPDIVSLAVQTVEETGPFGMKGIGEVGVNAPLPAVATAIRDAVGIRFRRSPLTPERILGALREKGPKGEDNNP